MQLTKKQLKNIADELLYKKFKEGNSCVTNAEKKAHNNAIMYMADKLAKYCKD